MSALKMYNWLGMHDRNGHQILLFEVSTAMVAMHVSLHTAPLLEVLC